MNADLEDKDSVLLLCAVTNLGTEKHTYCTYLHRNVMYKCTQILSFLHRLVHYGKGKTTHLLNTELVSHAHWHWHTHTHTHTSQAITVWRCQERQQIWVLESVGLTAELKIDVKEQQRNGGMEGNLKIRAEQITMSFLQHERLCHILGTAVGPLFKPTVTMQYMVGSWM